MIRLMALSLLCLTAANAQEQGRWQPGQILSEDLELVAAIHLCGGTLRESFRTVKENAVAMGVAAEAFSANGA